MGYLYENTTYNVRITDGVVTTRAGSLALSQVVAVRVEHGREYTGLSAASMVGRALEWWFWTAITLGLVVFGVVEFGRGVSSGSLGALGFGALLVGGGVLVSLNILSERPYSAVVVDTPAGPLVVARCASDRDAEEIRAGLEGGLRAAARPEGPPAS